MAKINPAPARCVGHLALDGVDLKGLCCSACCDDLPGAALDLAERAAREEDLGPFAGEGPGHGAADGPARPVDHYYLVLQLHSNLLVGCATKICRALTCRKP